MSSDNIETNGNAPATAPSEGQGGGQQPQSPPFQQSPQTLPQQSAQSPQREYRPSGEGQGSPGGQGGPQRSYTPRPFTPRSYTPRDGGDSGGGGPRGPRRPRPGGARGERYTPRRKMNSYCLEHIKYIDFKDVNGLRRFLSERGKIEPRRKTGANARCQRMITIALKRARHMALLPFVGPHNR